MALFSGHAAARCYLRGHEQAAGGRDIVRGRRRRTSRKREIGWLVAGELLRMDELFCAAVQRELDRTGKSNG